MNAVEIEAAVSDLAAEEYDAAEFPFQFLAAFDKKETTLKRLRKGDSNKSDVVGGVLLQSNIHLAVCPSGETRQTIERLKASPKTTAAKAKFVLATDGIVLEAEDLSTGETIASEYHRFAEHIGFFLPLAGISTIREIKDNPIDVRATGRLNKLYVELLRQNPDWGSEARRHDMNHFMARLIFCFFAEDTDIFESRSLFTGTVEGFSESDGSNTHHVIEACFATMNLKQEKRTSDNTPGYAVTFPYVNGGLFAGSTEVPQFTRIARSYLLQAGGLDWQHINPDIFGSMIQAVADDEERGALGMHYTSVPNILKVLNPLFLDELRTALEAAGDNSRTLLNLRRRLSRIRVFDPACGSGNFLVIAYKEMRKIEAEINARRGEHLRATEISKKNFRGIEIRDFAAEVARLALVIAEYQCDVLHRGPLAAKAEFLPLDEMNWITCGNALRLDWLQVCPSEGLEVQVREGGRLHFEEDASIEIAFENEGGETFICGNPPYLGPTRQDIGQKRDVRDVLRGRCPNVGNLDYVAAWFIKAVDYGARSHSKAAFVTTNSICQGQAVPDLWPVIYKEGANILFAHTSFKWANLASQNAGVIVAIVGIGKDTKSVRRLYIPEGSNLLIRTGSSITPYLTIGETIIVEKRIEPLGKIAPMEKGSQPTDGGYLLLSPKTARDAIAFHGVDPSYIKPLLGSEELINGVERRCLWIEASQYGRARQNPWLTARFDGVAQMRRSSPKRSTQLLADEPFRFGKIRSRGGTPVTIVPSVSSERREWYPAGQLKAGSVVSNLAMAI
jgi:hypothetical protein